MRQISPSGKILFYRIAKSVARIAHPALLGRASAVVTDVGRGAVDAWFMSDDGVDLSVRQKRVVLVPVAGIKLPERREPNRR